MKFLLSGKELGIGMPLPEQQYLPSGQMHRRDLLRLAGAALIPSMFVAPAVGQIDFWSLPRKLWIRRNTDKGMEEFNGVYFADGKLLLEPYVAISRLLRDVQAGMAVQMSPVLLDILCGVQGVARAHGHEGPLVTTSGYRSDETNRRTEGAAKASLHREGRAWDGRMPGYSAATVAESAQYLRGGGVGLYVGRGFCHVDDGRLRSWRGR